MEGHTELVALVAGLAVVAGIFGAKLLLQRWLHAQLGRVQIAARSVMLEAQGVLSEVDSASDTLGPLLVLEEQTRETQLSGRVRDLQELAFEARVLSLHAGQLLADPQDLSAFTMVRELRLLRDTFRSMVSLRQRVDEQLDWFDRWERAAWADTGASGLDAPTKNPGAS